MKQEIKAAAPVEQFEDDPGEAYLFARAKKSDLAFTKIKSELEDNQLYKSRNEQNREFQHQKAGHSYWNEYWISVYAQLKKDIPVNVNWRMRVFNRLLNRNYSENTTNDRLYNQELDCWFDNSTLVRPMICGYQSYIPTNFKYRVTCTKLPHHTKMDKLLDKAHGEWQRLK